MDILTFVSEVIKSLIWPVTILVITLLLKKPIVELIPKLSSMRYKDLELAFGKKVEELEQKADRANLPEKISDDDSSQFDLYEQYKSLANLSPRAAILETWMLVEQEINSAAIRCQVKLREYYPTPHKLAKELMKLQFISKEIYDIITEMQNLRNAAAHELDFQVPYNFTKEYILTAMRVIEALKSI